MLTDRGLHAAVEMLAGRSPVPVTIAAMPAERLPEPVEAAAYYLIAEALTNVAKYAQASAASRPRRRAATRPSLVEVSDNGIGGADPAAGSGLRGLVDRVEALGGTLDGHQPRRRRDDAASRAAARVTLLRLKKGKLGSEFNLLLVDERSKPFYLVRVETTFSQPVVVTAAEPERLTALLRSLQLGGGAWPAHSPSKRSRRSRSEER